MTFLKIIRLIEPKQLNKFFFLNFLFILLGFVEIVGIGSIIPFLNSISYNDIEKSDELNKTERGAGGFGSTGVWY